MSISGIGAPQSTDSTDDQSSVNQMGQSGMTMMSSNLSKDAGMEANNLMSGGSATDMSSMVKPSMPPTTWVKV